MANILDKINTPADIRKLSAKELNQLADEIREFIIDVISQRGGHLASSLGAVELTIALHTVFNTPSDKIIWDVGHQTYPHKILTGRKEKFKTIRTYGGLSGFPHPEESEYDPYIAGHASTAISIALGIHQAIEKKGTGQKVVAVVGDGSLTGGLSFEALNHAGQLKKNFTVILNDNKMSISPNVGALSAYLSKITTGTKYMKFRKEVELFLKAIPRIGSQVAKKVKQIEEALKSLIVPGILFEELGFKYVGPIDGHNIQHLIETLKNVKDIPAPVLVHVITQKGKGYPHAEDDPSTFHGASPFDIESGIFNGKKPRKSYTQIFADTLLKIAEKDKKVVAITAAMAEGTGLCRFREKFPDRFYDVGIAEQHAVTFAAGLASQGMKPVVAIYSTFLQRAYDQIIHDVCILKMPVIFAIDRAGIVGADGATHQGSFDLSYLRIIPNMTIMAPKDENELQHMLYSAFTINGPVAIRYPRGMCEGVEMDEEFKHIPYGKAEILTQGRNALIIACGNMVHRALCASEALKKEGIKTTVLNARFVKPIDKDTILSLAEKMHNIVIVEENVKSAGLGSAVEELLFEAGIEKVNLKLIGIEDEFVEHGSQKELRERYGLTEEGIRKAVKELLSHNTFYHKFVKRKKA
ncbi:MAG: 1-deoxy-D-xylulose-5-phosphate synthase [Candidatus Schekmanbacteria bacterium]|nr:MAG: 1-deoxy-D-xylulose-5-phosphate synthase [Candidatus Schekmanbacteria bacterium]